MTTSVCQGEPIRSVVGVVVTYNPDENLLREQTRQLKSQVHAIVWVDNASAHSLDRLAAELGVQLLQFEQNQGVARAQNAGVEAARRWGADAVLLMDHDSVPAADMVVRLCQVMGPLPTVAAVGPHYRDPRGESASATPFVHIEGLSMKRLQRHASEDSVEVDHLIASGCLIRMQAWDQVGPMNEVLFVDFVDVEWCLRARAQGWSVRGVWTAAMSHTIGHELVTRFGRRFNVHSPARMYFHVRNGLVLYRQPWIPLNWRLVSAYRLLLKVGFYLVGGPQRRAYAVSMGRGLKDGWRLRLNGASR